MALQFGKRPVVKNRPGTVAENPLAGAFNRAAEAGGGIQPGAHPQFNAPTPLERLGAGLKRAKQVIFGRGKK